MSNMMGSIAEWMENYVAVREQKQAIASEKAEQSKVKDGSDFSYAQEAIQKRNAIFGAPLWLVENWKLILLGFLAVVVILRD